MRRKTRQLRVGAAPPVGSAFTSVRAHEDTEEPSIAKWLCATGVNNSELNRTEVDFPAIVTDRLESDALLLYAVADVELHTVDADDAVMLDALDAEVLGVLELRQFVGKRFRGRLVE